MRLFRYMSDHVRFFGQYTPFLRLLSLLKILLVSSISEMDMCPFFRSVHPPLCTGKSHTVS